MTSHEIIAGEMAAKPLLFDLPPGADSRSQDHPWKRSNGQTEKAEDKKGKKRRMNTWSKTACAQK